MLDYYFCALHKKRARQAMIFNYGAYRGYNIREIIITYLEF